MTKEDKEVLLEILKHELAALSLFQTDVQMQNQIDDLQTNTRLNAEHIKEIQTALDWRRNKRKSINNIIKELEDGKDTKKFRL